MTIVVSHYLDPTPIDADEADRLARDYDQSLRSRLGLTDTAAGGGPVTAVRVALVLLAVALLGSSAARAEPAPPAAGAELETQSVGVRTLGDTRPPAVEWDAFARAPTHHPIDDETFYRLVARDDLVRAERQRAGAKATLDHRRLDSDRRRPAVSHRRPLRRRPR